MRQFVVYDRNMETTGQPDWYPHNRTPSIGFGVSTGPSGRSLAPQIPRPRLLALITHSFAVLVFTLSPHGDSHSLGEHGSWPSLRGQTPIMNTTISTSIAWDIFSENLINQSRLWIERRWRQPRPDSDGLETSCPILWGPARVQGPQSMAAAIDDIRRSNREWPWGIDLSYLQAYIYDGSRDAYPPLLRPPRKAAKPCLQNLQEGFPRWKRKANILRRMLFTQWVWKPELERWERDQYLCELRWQIRVLSVVKIRRILS